MNSHAQVPVPDHVAGDVYRVYFASRTEGQISNIGWAALELGDDVRVLEIGTTPVLGPGGIGTFEDHGVFPSCIVPVAGVKRMYYIGFSRGYRSPLFYASIGLAVSHDGGTTWTKQSVAPLLARSEHDPCLVTSPHVAWHGDRYRMTYCSGVRWSEVSGELKSHYHIKYADSLDGLSWRRDGRVAVDFSGPDETNVARSWVVSGASHLHMWFGYARANVPYRIGYAMSDDYLKWRRDDAAAGIDVSLDGWDSQMLCYPSIVVHRGRAFMFYNGNDYGRDGFGIAVREGSLH